MVMTHDFVRRKVCFVLLCRVLRIRENRVPYSWLQSTSHSRRLRIPISTLHTPKPTASNLSLALYYHSSVGFNENWRFNSLIWVRCNKQGDPTSITSKSFLFCCLISHHRIPSPLLTMQWRNVWLPKWPRSSGLLVAVTSVRRHCSHDTVMLRKPWPKSPLVATGRMLPPAHSKTRMGPLFINTGLPIKVLSRNLCSLPNQI